MFQTSIWGIDLGATLVRVVRLTASGGRYEIAAVDRIDLYRDPLQATPDELDQALRRALAIFVGNHKIKTGDRVGVAIPGLGFEAFLVELPHVEPARQKGLMDYELLNRFGVAGAHFVRAERKLPSPAAGEDRFLVATGSAGTLGAYLDALRSVDIEPDRLTIAPVALVDALAADGRETRSAVVVRLGVGTTDIAVTLRDGPHARTEADGTGWIARQLRQRHGLSEQEADQERRELEASRGNKRFADITKNYALRIAERVESVVNMTRAKNRGFTPRAIVLMGEGSRIPGVLEVLTSRLGAPVELHTSWHKIAFHRGLIGHALATEVPAFATAVGAALQASFPVEQCLTFVQPGQVREAARFMPGMGLATAVLALSVAGTDWMLQMGVAAAETHQTRRNELYQLIDQKRDLLKLQIDTRVLGADHARTATVAREWEAWERMMSRAHESLGAYAKIHRSSSRFDGRASQIITEITCSIPRGVEGATSRPVPAAPVVDSTGTPESQPSNNIQGDRTGIPGDGMRGRTEDPGDASSRPAASFENDVVVMFRANELPDPEVVSHETVPVFQPSAGSGGLVASAPSGLVDIYKIRLRVPVDRGTILHLPADGAEEGK